VQHPDSLHGDKNQGDDTARLGIVAQVAGDLAHDFSNLLTGILGNAQLLQIHPELTHDQRRYVDSILTACRRAGTLTQQLIGLSRSTPACSEEVDIHLAIRKVVALLRERVDPRIEIETELEAMSPVVIGDAARLRTALTDMGLNSCEAMPEGGVLVLGTQDLWLDQEYLALRAPESPPGRYVEICIRDSGSGMDNETLSRIFEPFFTTKAAAGRSGLGLAGVYGTVQRHRGFALAYSLPGAGTELRIMLPAADVADRSEGYAVSGLLHSTDAGRVLVVDDEQVIREYVGRVMGALGYDVVACSDGIEAEKYFRKHHREIDLVILDLTMPRKAGVETFAGLRAIDPDARIVISSGFSADERIRRLRKEGAVGFLQKPFRATELAELVARSVGMSD
jgi:nitrogen-specific signal transduction histidine kinase/ActR/RegA family two-component response regulator